MRPARLLVYSLLPLFAACQVWKPESPSTSVDTRFQGELVKINGALQFRPCTEKRLFSIEDVANTGLRREADSLFDDGAQGLFVDLRGTMGPAKVPTASWRSADCTACRTRAPAATTRTSSC